MVFRRAARVVEDRTPAAMEDLSLSQAELVERISWIINLRWLAFLGVTGTIVLCGGIFASPLPWNRLLLTALAIPIYNYICYGVWRRANRTAEHLERTSSYLANAQIACDLIVLGALIHFSGGVENPFGFYFVFHMVIASILLPPRAVFLQATLAVAIFTSVTLGEYYGVLPHYDSPIGVQFAVLHRNSVFVFAAIWVLTTSLYITVYLATSIASNLRLREAQIVAFSQQAQRDAEELRIAYDKLAEVDKAKSAYARQVAHELRSPLAAIESLLRVVSDGLQGEIPEKVRETVDQARRRARQLLAVVRDLLALAAATEAKDFPNWKEVDLGSILASVTQLLAAHAETRNIRVETEVSPDLPKVKADEEQVQELLTNLVDNAIKYSLDGGHVRISMSHTGGRVQIEVSDDGIGIDDADIDKVFEEFYRGRNARDFTPDGTGLGLSIMKSIVEAHAGAVAVHSRKGEGTTFTVGLPVAVSNTDIKAPG